MTPADLPAAERCPTCDREGCRRAAAVAAYQDAPAGVDLLPLVIALIDTERECLDAEIDGKRARRARDVAERKRAFEELRTAAARWAKVAPLIERLRAIDTEANARGTSEARLRVLRADHFDAMRAIFAAAEGHTHSR